MSDTAMPEQVLDRLGRRGTVTMTVHDGVIDLRFKAPGPYRGRAWCTTDEADLYEHCRLGAKDWHGEGSDLSALVVECEESTRPEHRDVNELVWSVKRRRDSRVYGPPLPYWTSSLYGWRPGQERWLRTFSHAHEYLGGYLRYVEAESADYERWASLYPDRYPPRVAAS